MSATICAAGHLKVAAWRLYSDTVAYNTAEFVILACMASTNFAEMPGGFTSPVTGGK